ncbi:hypothetical protein N9115_00175 [bacterium]|nr:hypothetical protein [bacterium]
MSATDALGRTATTTVISSDGAFTVNWPSAFEPKYDFVPGPLYLDAFSMDKPAERSEILLIIIDGKKSIPDLPQLFSDDFLSAQGSADKLAQSWNRNRALANHFMLSRAAKVAYIGRSDFDLDKESDFAFYKKHLSLYDFDHRDRDWSTKLGNRPAQGYMQSMWDGWFNESNNHFWDGNSENRSPENFRPYVFSNDLADMLIVYQMVSDSSAQVADNRKQLTEDLLKTLMTLQHHGKETFCLPTPGHKTEIYTAGAFRYGMFESGEWLTETKGWFKDPDRRDFAYGGVLNGRSMWALGESLRANPQGPQREAILRAIQGVLRFCFFDGQALGYTELTKSGHPFWLPPGEQGYLLKGMVAACSVCPDLAISVDDTGKTIPLKTLTRNSLNALTEKAGDDGLWTFYANCNAVNLAALAEGAREFPSDPDRNEWIAAASKAAQAWLEAKPISGQASGESPLFGHTLKPEGMDFVLGSSISAADNQSFVSLYVNGHWLHALAALYSVQPKKIYRDRAAALVAYYFGDNDVQVRLYNELGAVYNRVTDSNGDGRFDQLRWDAYPESTAFFQIGLIHYLRFVHPYQR